MHPQLKEYFEGDFYEKIISLFAAVMIIASIFAGCGAGSPSKINVMTREEGSGTRSAFIELFGIETEDESGEKLIIQ